MEFSRQEYWSGLPFPFPGDLPNPGIKPRSSMSQADSSPSEPPGKPLSVISEEGKALSVCPKVVSTLPLPPAPGKRAQSRSTDWITVRCFSLSHRGRVPGRQGPRQHSTGAWLWPPLPVWLQRAGAKDHPALQAPEPEELRLDVWCLLWHDGADWRLWGVCNRRLPGGCPGGLSEGCVHLGIMLKLVHALNWSTLIPSCSQNCTNQGTLLSKSFKRDLSSIMARASPLSPLNQLIRKLIWKMFKLSWRKLAVWQSFI